ncbi:MAG: HIT domain-containing protein, partial [Deltaproteobacteria bacterium]|nr:HIT domain-containing protein [Deltaproteobacteria bacterium]
MAADNLWAPWRMEFIKDKRFKTGEAPCVFCELKEKKPDEQNLVLYQGKNNYIVMNRFPYTTGHLLVVSHEHTADLKTLSADAHGEIMGLLAKGMEVLKEVLGAEGFNCGVNVGRVGGCGILDHLHWHIVPRWTGDTNFLPVLTGSRCMPEYLGETHK